MTITKELLNTVRADMDAALATIAKARGLTTLKCGKCIYNQDAGNFTMKVDGIAEGGKDASATLYDKHAKAFGLPPRGTSFTNPSDGNIYTVCGMTGGGKVICEQKKNNKRYTYRSDAVLRLVEFTKKKEAA